MVLPTSLQIALKEWDSICRALENGRQIVLLRKGGIYEAAGEFELENPQFVLFPTFLHQDRKMLKAEAQADVQPASAEPAHVRLSAAANVTDIVRLVSRQQMDAIQDEHVWAPSLIDMRFNYKPENPLYLLLLRVYRLGRPVILPNTPVYAGCKSWVPLEGPIWTDEAAPVLDDKAYDDRRRRILVAIGDVAR